MNGRDGGAEPGRHSIGDAQSAEIYSYQSKAPVFAMNWSVRKDKRFRLALGSFKEECTNYVEVISLDEEKGEFRSDPALTFSHGFPATKLMFCPDKEGATLDLLATTGEFLRVWKIQEDGSGVTLERNLHNRKQADYCSPLTSFDWNEVDPKRVGTSSIDTTVTIWDIEAGEVDTQLIAHDKEVYDIAWGGLGVFATVSADGSVRVFDLRDKEHSTIIYESPRPDTPLLRLAWNKQDPRYMATLLYDSPKVVVLDIRFPTMPVVELARHQACANAMAWAPHSSQHICTAGEDSQALIWDLSGLGATPEATLDPILAYNAGGPINQLQWSSAQPDWVAICFGSTTQVLRV